MSCFVVNVCYFLIFSFVQDVHIQEEASVVFNRAKQVNILYTCTCLVRHYPEPVLFHHNVSMSKRKRQMSSALFGSFCRVQCAAPRRGLCDPLPGVQGVHPNQTHPVGLVHNNRMESDKQHRRHLPFPLRYSHSMSLTYVTLKACDPPPSSSYPPPPPPSLFK